MAWFYVANLPEASTLLLHDRFPGLGDTVIPRDNRSGGEAAPIAPADAEHLIPMNLLDYEIFDFAVRLQAERLPSARSLLAAA